ncbi:MAG: hypothetical protein ABW252_03735 [Polyangiales bacterium]
MSTFPGAPRLVKGALIGADLFNPLASVVVFQYNPESLSRRLEPRAAGGDGERGEAYRLTGAPKETITVSVELDATDQLERAHPVAVAAGLGPTLSSLELLLYPKSARVIANSIMSALGIVEVLPTEGPLTLFVWGPTRVLPVRLTSLSITEEAHDPQLNPTRAKAELSLQVLSYNDLQLASPTHALFLVHQITKELLATRSLFDNAANPAAGLKLW